MSLLKRIFGVDPKTEDQKYMSRKLSTMFLNEEVFINDKMALELTDKGMDEYVKAHRKNRDKEELSLNR